MESIRMVYQFMKIAEIEALRKMNYQETLLSVHEFIDCWAQTGMRIGKKNFCKGCWEQHIEKERYVTAVANIFE